MAAQAARNARKTCGLCNKWIPESEYREHVGKCEGPESHVSKPVIKTCAFCGRQVQNLEDHITMCNGVNSTEDNIGGQPLMMQMPIPNHSRQSPTTVPDRNNGNEYRVHEKKAANNDRYSSTPIEPAQYHQKIKECVICKAKIEESAYGEHMEKCASRLKNDSKPMKKTKECVICQEMIDDDVYVNHVDACALKLQQDLQAPKKTKQCVLCSEWIPENDYINHVRDCAARSKNSIKITKKTKECVVCHENVDEDVFINHIDACAMNMRKELLSQKKTKQCVLCHEWIPENDYVNHLERCAVRSSNNARVEKKTKTCPICQEVVEEHRLVQHIEQCQSRSTNDSMPIEKTKNCIVCSKAVAEKDFVSHLERCAARSTSNARVEKKTKTCPICQEVVEEHRLARHIEQCESRSTNHSMPIEKTKNCIVCSKAVTEDDFDRHLEKCLQNSSSQPARTSQSHRTSTRTNNSEYRAPAEHAASHPKQSTRTRSQTTCFTCSASVDLSAKSSHAIPCRNHHIYCIACLRRSMNDFIQSKTAPRCHLTICDFEFSQYDVECFPLEKDLIQRLIPLVKVTRRVQCPVCNFYVDFKSLDDYQRHVVNCDVGNMFPCEYCLSLFKQFQLGEHSRQCRTASGRERQQSLIEFVLPRTKYPLTKAQMQVFIENRKKSRVPIDPHSIVDTLADYDGAFPYEVLTHECGVCMEQCLYEDVFVFGCKDNHKLCYNCFERSCTSKMNNNELLTCGLCTYQLQDGEIKQLKLPVERVNQFVKYQLEKSFSAYVSGTTGVIKCPNQGCKWVAETENPNDRRRVDCPICKYEFCSLCSQQYHYRTTCQQLPEITQRWFFWCERERGNYWQARAQQDASFRAQLEDHEKQKAANIQRNQELAQRYNELLADENFKAQSCRLCPHCRRVVERISGCDSMVCGRNYHGGDQQSGCGQRFSWPQALPYVPIANTGPEQVRVDMPPPEQQKLVVHQGVQCAACKGAVQGIRFDCVHCSSLTFCEKCEQRATLDHSNQIRNRGKQQHVFRIITEPLN